MRFTKTFLFVITILMGMFICSAGAREGTCNMGARIILTRVARHVQEKGNIYARQSFPQLSEKDQASVKKLTMRNIRVIKKLMLVGDPYMKEVIVAAVYPNLDEAKLKSDYPKFVDAVYKFKNELLEGRANVPPPGKKPEILEMPE